MRIISSASAEEAKGKAVQYLSNELSTASAQSKDVLWLVSGGSSIAVTAAVAQGLDIAHSKRIIVGQVDERFVPPGSKEENWQQLITAGFDPNKFKQTVSMLSAGSQAEAIAKNYAHLLEQFIKQVGHIMGVFGIGADGHTAGIKPTPDGRSFKQFKGPELVVSYQADDFQRLTITEPVIKKMDSIVVYAHGEEKRPVVNQLNVDLPAHSQPAQLLKQVTTAVVFN